MTNLTPPNNFKSTFLNEISIRGFINQYSNLEDLDKLLTKQKIKAYIGFDCTADSLHVGSLIPIMLLRLLQKHGHTPVVLLGGATSLIGDPSGKDKSRQLLSKESIEHNKSGIKKVLNKYLNNNVIFVDNIEWLSTFNYLDFLRDYGTLFTINRMLTFESVKTRLDRLQPLSFLEFNYMLLQAVDFLYLYKNHDVLLQLGGSDQWGNIINGVELIKKAIGKEAFALTLPLITKSDGTKMGKTVQGAIWLSEDKISAWDYYQFWRNTEDVTVIKFLKLFTDLSCTEISKYAHLQGKDINVAKKVLAFETTKITFGINAATKCKETANEVFEKGINSNNLPTIELPENNLNNNLTISEFITHLKLTGSKTEARKLILNNGVKVNDNIVTNPLLNIDKKIFINNQLKISIGKKKHILIKLI